MLRVLPVSCIALILLCVSVSPANAATAAENLLKKSDEWFHTNDGRKALENILSWQTDHGDWPKNTDTTSKTYSGDRAKLRGTFDNGATTGELRTLARGVRLTGEARYKEAFLKGFDHVVAAQYSNGGWPQHFPLRKGYSSHITFNDNCMTRILQFLQEVASRDDSFLDEERRAAATRAVNLGIECIIKCQIVVNGTRTVWCAQHDAVTLAPAQARSYELASLSGGESASILKFLMKIKNPSPDVIRAVKAGVSWFEATKIEGYRYNRGEKLPVLTKDSDSRQLWARFYEIETNRPFFCDRDGVIKYDIEQIGSERRGGYSWYGHWGESMANEYRKWPHRS